MLMQKGGRTFTEILEQPDCWASSIRLYNKERETLIWIKKMRFEQIIFIGCGASYAAAMVGSWMFRDVGKVNAIAFPASELVLSENLPFDIRRRTLVIALSKSGETHEVAWAMNRLRKIKPDLPIMVLTCNGESELIGQATKSIITDMAMDDGVVAIKSFSTTLYVLALIAAAIGGQGKLLQELSKIPKMIEIRKYYDAISKMRKLSDVKSITFCGTGFNWGLAQYGSLLVKEMSLTPANYLQTLEVRHGHFVSASPTSLFVYLLSENSKELQLEAMHDTAKLRALMFLVAEDMSEMVEAGVEYAIKLKTDLSPYSRIFYTIPIIQAISFQHAICKGMNPDKPKHLTGAVKYRHKMEF
ncbi:MAG: SIS domain-containing protein [Candidatus Eremiobacteraeota bacterium]|nr:SIS domain-containing protein [Candidatus Eremiobacteraeota bacterium]